MNILPNFHVACGYGSPPLSGPATRPLKTTLGREDEGEISLPVAHPSGGGDGAFRPSRVDMFGSCGNVDGFESSSTRRGLEKSANGDSRRGSRDQAGRGDELGMGISVEAGVESGLRVEFFSTEFREGDGEGYEAAIARDLHPTGQGHGERGLTLFVCSFDVHVREVDLSRNSG